MSSKLRINPKVRNIVCEDVSKHSEDKSQFFCVWKKEKYKKLGFPAKRKVWETSESESDIYQKYK